jgi:hypothetical protein
MSHRRNGKVARLPKAAREQVNLLLDDGKTYAQIIQWLAANGFPGFNAENIRQWKNGGFQDWLNHHDELSESEKLREMAIDVAERHNGGKTQEAALHIGASLVFRTFLKFDSNKLSRRLDRKPEHITTLMNSFTRLSRRSEELGLIKKSIRQEDEQEEPEPDGAFQTNSKQFKAVQTKK